MGRSWKITRIAGIDVSVHWTFGLLLAWILIASATGVGLGHGLAEVGFVLALFACVLLHEFGHAFAARIFGIPTHDITLLPIGGVARLERMPRNPRQEAIIALAGPAVNVLIVGLLFPAVVALQGASLVFSPLAFTTHFLVRLLWVNVGLVVFNLIPAFPMDGGRLLRALLAGLTDYVTATRMAKQVGQVVAVVFAILSFWTTPTLLLVAGFVFFAAETEYRMVRDESRWKVWQPIHPESTRSERKSFASHPVRRTPSGAVIAELVSEPGTSAEARQDGRPSGFGRDGAWVVIDVTTTPTSHYA